MGYSYGKGGLVCDGCSTDQGTKKRSCLHEWCPPAALCDSCFAKEAPNQVAVHAKCAVAAAGYRERRTLEEKLLAEGRYVRSSAKSVQRESEKKVHVIFRNSQRQTIGYFMESSTYQAIPLLTPALVEDFTRIGEIEPAPADYA